MELTRLSVFALFGLALVGIVTSQSAEDLPKALSDLLLPYSGANVPIRAEEDEHHTSLFFIHDLYPGKKMSGLQKLSDIQPFRSIGWLPVGKASQPSGIPTQNGNTIERERYSLDEICGSPAGIGEDKYCASSLESMRDFAISKLGTNIKKISGSFAKNQDQYVVEEVKKIADKGVMCHRLNFEKVVFYCHQVNATTSYMVPLVASDGTEVKALAACHHDTRGMNPSLLYEVLKVKPGTVPVCHFVGNKAVAWIPNPIVSDSDDHPCVN